MAEPYIWGNLNRALNDPTLIDEAIDEAIAAHNDDPDSHLGPEQSLESHRAAEIIDHRAESVLNDKLAPSARTFTAIVDPTSEYDFDSIESALAYVIDKGGGTILVAAGSYNISSKLELPVGINIIGQGIENTTITCSVSGGTAFSLGGDALGGNRLSRIESIGFVRSSGTIFEESDDRDAMGKAVEFADCSFSGGGNYCTNITDLFLFDRCHFFANTTAALSIEDGTFYDCSLSSTGAGIFMNQSAVATDGAKLVMIGCRMESTGSQLINGTFKNSIIDRCSLGLCIDTVPLCRLNDSANTITNTSIVAAGSNDLYIRGLFCHLTNNNFTAEDGDGAAAYIRLATTSDSNLVATNTFLRDLRSDRGVNNLVQNNLFNYSLTDDRDIGVTHTYNKAVALSGIPSGANTLPVIHPNGLYCVTYHATNKQLHVYKYNGTAFAWLKSVTYTTFTSLTSIVFSHDGLKLLVRGAGSANVGVFTWDGESITFAMATLPAATYTRSGLFVGGDASIIALADGSQSSSAYYIRFYRFNGTNYDLMTSYKTRHEFPEMTDTNEELNYGVLSTDNSIFAFTSELYGNSESFRLTILNISGVNVNVVLREEDEQYNGSARVSINSENTVFVRNALTGGLIIKRGDTGEAIFAYYDTPAVLSGGTVCTALEDGLVFAAFSSTNTPCVYGNKGRYFYIISGTPTLSFSNAYVSSLSRNGSACLLTNNSNYTIWLFDVEVDTGE